jgi:hypothetical protein
MQISEIECLCQELTVSVSEVRTLFRSSFPVAEILDRFWALQDNLSRLLEAISDYPAETLEVLESHPRLLTDVVDVLEFLSKLPDLRQIAAVRESAEAIKNSLLEIQCARQTRAVAASA